MRAIIISLLLIIGLNGFGQNSVVGKYHDWFGSNLEIKADSTFNFTVRYSLMGSWSKGTWEIMGQTLVLSTVSVFDTLQYDSNNVVILSPDEHSELILLPIVTLSNSCAQHRIEPPKKLIFQDDKLFLIGKNGKPIKKKLKHYEGNKKVNPYYSKY